MVELFKYISKIVFIYYFLFCQPRPICPFRSSPSEHGGKLFVIHRGHAYFLWTGLHFWWVWPVLAAGRSLVFFFLCSPYVLRLMTVSCSGSRITLFFFLKPDAVGRSAFSLFYFFFYFQGVRYRITWSNYATTISVVAIAMRSPPRRILNPSRLFASDRHFLALVPSCCVSVLRWSPAQVFIVYRWQSCYTAIYRIIGLTCLRFHS